MGEVSNLLHGLVGLLGAAVAGTIATIFGRSSQGTSSGAPAHARPEDLELDLHGGWSRGRVAALSLLLAASTVIFFVWRPPQNRVIVAGLLLAGCAAITVYASHSLAEELTKGRIRALTSFPMVTMLVCGFVSAYIVFPDLPISTGPAPTAQPSPTPTASPDTSANSPSKGDSPSSAAPEDSNTVAPTPEPTIDSPIPTSSVEPPSISDKQRKKQIEQLQTDLHSKYEGTRRGAFKGAMDSDDSELRDSALSTALRSPYHDLRSSALPSAIRTSPSFVLRITGTDGKADSATLRDKLGREFDVQVTRFDRSANTFIASSPASGAVATAGGVPFPRNRPGAVAGEHLNFSFDVALVEPGEGCYGVARLSGTSGMLTGSMHCVGNLTANYSIEINILK